MSTLNQKTIKEIQALELVRLIKDNKEDEAIKFVGDYNVDINYIPKNCPMPLIMAINRCMMKFYELSINNEKFNPNIYNEVWDTLLGLLIYFSQTNMDINMYSKVTSMIEQLLKHKNLNVNQKDINGDTALTIACTHPSNIWIVKSLLSRDEIDVNAITNFNESALSISIEHYNTEAFKLLIERKDIIIRDKDKEIFKKYEINLSDYNIN